MQLSRIIGGGKGWVFGRRGIIGGSSVQVKVYSFMLYLLQRSRNGFIIHVAVPEIEQCLVLIQDGLSALVYRREVLRSFYIFSIFSTFSTLSPPSQSNCPISGLLMPTLSQLQLEESGLLEE